MLKNAGAGSFLLPGFAAFLWLAGGRVGIDWPPCCPSQQFTLFPRGQKPFASSTSWPSLPVGLDSELHFQDAVGMNNFLFWGLGRNFFMLCQIG